MTTIDQKSPKRRKIDDDLSAMDTATEFPVFVTNQIQKGQVDVIMQTVEELSKDLNFRRKLEELVHMHTVDMKDHERFTLFENVQSQSQVFALKMFAQYEPPGPEDSEPEEDDDHWSRPCLLCYENSVRFMEYPSRKIALDKLIEILQGYCKCSKGYLACDGHRKCLESKNYEWKISDFPDLNGLGIRILYKANIWTIQLKSYQTWRPIDLQFNENHLKHEAEFPEDYAEIIVKDGEKTHVYPNVNDHMRDLQMMIEIDLKLLPHQYELFHETKKLEANDPFPDFIVLNEVWSLTLNMRRKLL